MRRGNAKRQEVEDGAADAALTFEVFRGRDNIAGSFDDPMPRAPRPGGIAADNAPSVIGHVPQGRSRAATDFALVPKVAGANDGAAIWNKSLDVVEAGCDGNVVEPCCLGGRAQSVRVRIDRHGQSRAGTHGRRRHDA